MENVLRYLLTAATAFALLAGPAFAQSDPTDDRMPEIVPGVENNDSDTDDVTSEGVAADNADTVGARIGTTVTATGATSTMVETGVVGPGENTAVPGVENNDSAVIIQGQNDPVTTGAAVAAATTVAPGTILVPGGDAEANVAGSIGVTGTDDGEGSTSSGGLVPGQTPN